MAAGFEHIRVEREGRVFVVTIDRRHAMNALTPDAHLELERAFDAFAADAEAWLAVITGAGSRAFCAGSDLKWIAEHGEAPKPPTGFAGLTSRFDLDKPVLAMVNGAALGGGLELALACDLVVAAEHATFGLPEPRVGLAALGGGLQRIARQLPLKLAMELVLTGRTIDAAEAYRLGLVNRVVPAAELKTATWALIDEVLACAPPAVRASKAILMASLDEPSLESSIRAEHPAAPRMYSSLDAIEGPRAFAEKRRPRWQGR